MQVREILSVVVLGSLLSACGSSTSTAPATMSVRLVDAPSPGYSEVNVDVQTVEIASSGGWITLGTPNRIVNLLALTGGVSSTLVDGATLPAGHYGQMRLVLGSRNTVKLLDGTIEPLTVPSGQQSGVKLVVSFDVQAGTTYDVYIDFDAHRSVFVHEAGASGKYILRPTVRAYDRLETGSISGTFGVSGPTGPTGPVPAPLPGVVVTAQTVSGGTPTVVRSTTTDAAGHYILDLLPRGGTYYVVSQPVTVDTAGLPVASYDPRSSAGIPITVDAPVRTYDALFTVATATGALSGAVTPVAVVPQVDQLDALLPLDIGGSLQPFVVRSVTAAVSGGAESYAMAALPTGTPSWTYTVVGQRRSVDASGIETVVSSGSATAPVPAGGAATANVAFPP
jgi:hypothetical protein